MDSDFRYDEAMRDRTGAARMDLAQGLARGVRFIPRGCGGSSHARLSWINGYFPGRARAHRQNNAEKGLFEILFLGKPSVSASDFWTARVTGDKDPGYAVTSKMLAESAICLAQDGDQLPVGGGFWTPATCFGMTLIRRLQQRAGMQFTLVKPAENNGNSVPDSRHPSAVRPPKSGDFRDEPKSQRVC